MPDRPVGNGVVDGTRGEDALQTRSQLLRKAAVTGGAVVGGSGLLAALPATAQAHKGRRRRKGGRVQDVDILNYALTLEHLEATFYTQGLQRFGEDDFGSSPLFDDFGVIGDEVYENFVRIRDHEQAHVRVLEQVIRSLGRKPVPPCEYNFETTAFTSLSTFVSVAQVLENTGVMAYDGAIAYINRPGLVTAGATIATVEARHASYLNLINGDVPFPEAFDTPKAPREICELVDELFIVACPFDLARFCKSLPGKVLA